MADQEKPLGDSVIPARYTWVMVMIATILYSIGEELSNPLPWTTQRWGGAILKLVPALMGIVMPGWRNGGVVSAAALKVLPLLVLVPFMACAPLHAGTSARLGAGAFDFDVQRPECQRINSQRSNWGAAGKVSGGVAAACLAGGGLYASASRDGLSQGEAIGLASCAVVAGGVVLLATSKAEDLAHDWAGQCTTPQAALEAQ